MLAWTVGLSIRRFVTGLIGLLTLTIVLLGDAYAGTLSSSPCDGLDRQRIQAHLLTAETVLRARDVGAMPPSSREARRRSLDVLRRYALRGVFPRNTKFPTRRVPFFLDEEGRPCAVAELVIQSGHPEIANRVASTENNAYLAEMATPELLEWAATSGFSLDELAYIQPDYCHDYDTDDTNYLACAHVVSNYNPSGDPPCTYETTTEPDGEYCRTKAGEKGMCDQGECIRTDDTGCGIVPSPTDDCPVSVLGLLGATLVRFGRRRGARARAPA